MDESTNKHLAEIRRRGGRRSRAAPRTRRQPARWCASAKHGRAFRELYATCFSSHRADLEIGSSDVEWVAETAQAERESQGLAGRGAAVPLTNSQRGAQLFVTTLPQPSTGPSAITHALYIHSRLRAAHPSLGCVGPTLTCPPSSPAQPLYR